MPEFVSVGLQVVGGIALIAYAIHFIQRADDTIHPGNYTKLCNKLVCDFGKLVDSGSEAFVIYDEKFLPQSKALILAAFEHELLWETKPERIEAMQITAQSLAQYQPNVGDKPVKSLMSAMALVPATTGTSSDVISRHREEFARYQDLEPLVTQEVQSIHARLAAVVEKAKSLSLSDRVRAYRE